MCKILLMKIVILTSRFYPKISNELERTTEEELKMVGADFEKIEIRGCVELPLAAQHVIRTKKPDAVIALGVVIQGQTDHYKWVCESCERGLTRVALDEGVPIVHGIIVSPTRELAEARTKNGKEYAFTALEMIKVMNS